MGARPVSYTSRTTQPTICYADGWQKVYPYVPFLVTYEGCSSRHTEGKGMYGAESEGVVTHESVVQTSHCMYAKMA